ncbi:MAG TPA: septum formation initiator family protein [Candidatus Acidoferrales bacterium]|nr:septum formation initiator family protein [Candidatus Acidoferrales bacterium]
MATQSQVHPGQAATTFFERHLRTILGVAIAALAIHDLFGAHGFLAMRRAQNQIAELRTQIDKLNSENETLEHQINRLKSDPKMIEKIARDEMMLQRPGEHVFKLPPSADPPKQASHN